MKFEPQKDRIIQIATISPYTNHEIYSEGMILGLSRNGALYCLVGDSPNFEWKIMEDSSKLDL